MTTIQQMNSTYYYLRYAIEPWRLESLSKGGNKCCITRKTSHLTVHHHDVNFKQIMRETFLVTGLTYSDDVHDFTRAELQILAKTCLDLHWKHGLGVILHISVHEALHTRYGPKVTKEQFKQYRLYRQNKKKKAA